MNSSARIIRAIHITALKRGDSEYHTSRICVHLLGLRLLCLLAALLTLSIGTGCGNEKPATAPPPRLVARFGSGVITRDEFLAGFAKASYRQASAYLTEMALQEVMMREAKTSGVEFTHAELATYVQELKEAYGADNFERYLSRSGLSYSDWLSQAKADLIRSKLVAANVTAKVEVSQDELEQYYEEHGSELEEPQRVRARQILVKNGETAKQILRFLSRRKRSFESLATEYSVAPEAAQGGDLGWVRKGDLPPEMGTPIFSLKEGKRSKVIHTSFGYHIFKVEKIQEARVPPFAEVKEKVRARVFDKKAKSRYDEWVKELKSKWQLQVFPEEIL